ncbi:alpha/beta hydrolase [Xanthomonas albilineans]|uniref:Putative carboxylesterase protein n=1 Tax=Xanthomonas albilineans (strain GPE PC73 / CFBP 7063) TaxID=380358 RepID=D2UFA6_XANAP|nr:alpha/beta hydrolase [Xanthomonas albilineans]QHQ29308.1 putative carboxylesterase protein [Xanthomonas albilineans]CBA17067.1 putative carboxylesterase protein [Xanthomonas albilineans GPE PC73]
MLETVEHETGAAPRWTVLWLHGLGADGHDFAPLVPQLVRPGWPSLRFVFPHAPMRAVTINNGVRMRAWYDIVSMDFAHRADSSGVAASVAQVEELIAREHARGVPAERLLLAGFSQGGAITLAAGLRRQQPLAGLIGLSTYLPELAEVARWHAPTALSQPLFMAHGQSDPVIPQVYAEQTAQALRALGMPVQWQGYPMAHQVCPEEVADLGDWMAARFAAV